MAWVAIWRVPLRDDAPWIHREGMLWHEPSHTALLFAREHRREGCQTGGITEPFRCPGFARYESHEGEQPMAIRWRLERAIPVGWIQGMGLAV